MPAVPDAHAKLKLCGQETARRGGILATFQSLADAVGLSTVRITQIFGKTNPTAEKGVDLATLQKIANSFCEDGLPLEAAWFELPYPEFAARIVPRALTVDSPAVSTTQDPTPPSPDWLPAQADIYTGTDSDPPDPIAQVAVYPGIPNNFYGDGAYTIPTAVAFSRFERWDEASGKTIVGAIAAATLRFTSDAYYLASGTLVGADPDAPPGITSDGISTVTFNATAIDAAPTLNGQPHLDKNPLQGRVLGVIVPRDGQPATQLSLTLQASHRSLLVAVLDDDGEECPDPAPSAAKAALMSLLFAQTAGLSRARNGTLTLARATLHRKPTDPT